MAIGDTRLQEYPTGIVPGPLGRTERRVPAGEAPPLAPNADLVWIGKPVPRINGRAKVTGKALFTVDVKLPGMLYARLLRSPLPHARLLSLDFGMAERYPGVRAVLPFNETVGRAVEVPAPAGSAEPASRRVLYVGDIVAGVAAVTPAAAEAALRLIHADYQPLPFVVDIERARSRRRAARISAPGACGELCGWRGAAAAGQRTRAEQGRLEGQYHRRLRPGRRGRRRGIPHARSDPLLP